MNSPDRNAGDIREDATIPPEAEMPATTAPDEGAEAATLPPSDPAGDDTRSMAFTAGRRESPVPEADRFEQSYSDLVPLGRWRYGELYLATHAKLHRRVRLRLLDDEHAASDDIRETFLKDARTAASIRHPNVSSRILEAGNSGSKWFVVLEAVDVQPLPDFAPRPAPRRHGGGLYPNARLNRVLLETALGLEAIHAGGLHHGHLRPETLQIDGATGAAWIVGLGEPPDDAQQTPATPELSRPPLTDPQTRDVEELARALVRLVTGREVPLPETWGTSGKLAQWISRQNPEVAPPTAAVLACCLTKGRDTIRSASQLVEQAQSLDRREVVRAGWGRRLLSLGVDLPLILALSPWVFAIVLILSLGGSFSPGAPKLFESPLVLIGASLLVAAALYVSFSEIVFGWTPGHRLLGLRLMDRHGTRARRRWMALRCLVGACWFLSLLALAALIGWWLAADDWVAAVWIGAAVCCLVYYSPALLFADRLALHERLSGTFWGRYVEHRAAVSEAPRRGVNPFATGSNPFAGAPSLPAAKSRIGQYLLEEELGRGGMGAVYRARDEVLQRKVAVKVITPEFGSHSEALKRFEREARLAAALKHENVAGVYAVGREDQHPYLVMEYIEGQNLQEIVERRGALRTDLAWDYVLQAARGLQEAQEHKIVHRDIKPSNLMITADGTVKLMDFGVSKLISDAGHEAEESLVSSEGSMLETAHGDDGLTRAGALLGTPMYMSPEQAQGKPLDHRSDIYSLGLTLYYLLSARTPFTGDLYDLVVRQCTEHPEPLQGKVPRFTEEQAAVLERMIAKSPGDRYASYSELIEDLEHTKPQSPPLADFAARFAAHLIDGVTSQVLAVIVLVVLAGLFIGTERMVHVQTWTTVAVALAGMLIYVGGIGLYGQTPGKWLLRLRVTRLDGRPLGMGRAFLRCIVYAPMGVFTILAPLLTINAETGMVINGVLSFVTLVLLTISAALVVWSPSRRALHDRACGSRVMQLPKRIRRKG